ncbi:hypothetical protein JD969_07470 [Planctomycetota bacterium]|nr:hypothetical protein JD969_07470 [Planctomycetota bacterium]
MIKILTNPIITVLIFCCIPVIAVLIYFAFICTIAFICDCLGLFKPLTPEEFQAKVQAAIQQAHDDIAHNHLELRRYGTPAPASNTYKQIILDRYQIHTNVVAFCRVTELKANTSKAYNAIMQVEIARRFGPDALSQALEEAEAIHLQQYK